MFGPHLQTTLNMSEEPVMKLISGTQNFPLVTYRWVAVRNAAHPHILAFYNPLSAGRYSLVGGEKSDSIR